MHNSQNRILVPFLAAAFLAAVLAGADEADDQFNFATGLLIKNEPRLAADEFRGLLDKHPQYRQADVARYRLGEALQKSGDAAGARAMFEQLLKDHPQSERVVAARYALAQLLTASDPRRAAAYYAAVAGVRGHALAEPAAFGQGEALYAAADWTNAATAYSLLLDRYTNGVYATQALYSRGWSRFQAGDYAQAVSDFAAFAERHATHELAPECRLKQADCLLKLKRYPEALQVYGPLAAAGGKTAGDALAGKAWTLYEQGKFADALPAFQEAAKAFGQEPRAAVYLFNAGTAAVEAQQFQVAADLFKQVPKGWPAHELARPSRYWEALACLRLGRADETVALLEELRKAGPPKDLAAETILLLAEARTARQEHTAAAALYAEALKEFPNHPHADRAAAGRVLALEKAGDLAGAEAASAAFVAAYPRSAQLPAMRFLLGEYRYRQGKFAEAAPALEAFLNAHPGHELAADAAYKAGWCYWNLKQPDKARGLFAVVSAKFPNSPSAADAAFMEGRACEETGNPADAAKSYALAVKLGKDGDAGQRAAVELIRLDQANKRYDAALAKAEAFIAAHTTGAPLARARLYRGEALLELGRTEEALAAYRQVGQADASVAAAAQNGAAWALRKLGRHAEAAEEFGRVAAGGSSYAADATFWAARSQEDAGHHDLAAAGYDACLKQTPPGPHADEATFRRAVCAWQLKQYDDAQRRYLAFIAEHPASPLVPNARYDLAWVMLDQGRKDDAQRQFESVVKSHPQHPLAVDAQFRIGELAYEKESFAAAATAYEPAAAANVPFRDKALYKLGWAREKAGQKDAALLAFQTLAKDLPASELAPEARYRAGRLLQGLGKFDEACAALAAVNAGPFVEKAAFNAAECLRAAGKPVEALTAYDAVLTRWPQGECRVPALLGRGHALRANGAHAEAIVAYDQVVKATEGVEAAQALLGQGYSWFAQKKWDDAAKAFLKVDILYGYEEVKPEALDMLAQTWTQAGDADKAAKYRDELKKRYPAAVKTP